MSCPSHSSRFYHPQNIGYRSFSPSLCSFLHSPVTSSLLGPNNLLNTLFSNTLSLRSSHSVSDQVSMTDNTRQKMSLDRNILALSCNQFCRKTLCL
jgi:hypothetical protein